MQSSNGSVVKDPGQGTKRSGQLIVVVGLLLSLVTAVLLPMLATGVDAGIQILLGLVTFSIGYLLTMDLAFRKRVEELEVTILARLTEVDRSRLGALPLQRLLSVPAIESAVIDIVEAAADTHSKRMPFLANRTIERIQLGREETLQIANGVFRCGSRREELRLVQSALVDSRHNLKAVAGLGLEAWRTFRFQEYFEVYLEHAKRLQQQRIFLVTADEAVHPEMIALLERHRDAGVETHALLRDEVPAHLAMPMVLFDDALLLLHQREDPSIPDGPVEVAFTDDPTRALHAAEDFASLLRLSQRSGPSLVAWSSQAQPTS